jgi:hypothetical protein
MAGAVTIKSQTSRSESAADVFVAINLDVAIDLSDSVNVPVVILDPSCKKTERRENVACP